MSFMRKAGDTRRGATSLRPSTQEAGLGQSLHRSEEMGPQHEREAGKSPLPNPEAIAN